MNNLMQTLMGLLQSGQSPQAVLNQMLMQNPQARNFLNNIQNQANGRTPKEIAFQLAKQNGMDVNQLVNLASRLGLH